MVSICLAGRPRPAPPQMSLSTTTSVKFHNPRRDGPGLPQERPPHVKARSCPHGPGALRVGHGHGPGPRQPRRPSPQTSPRRWPIPRGPRPTRPGMRIANRPRSWPSRGSRRATRWPTTPPGAAISPASFSGAVKQGGHVYADRAPAAPFSTPTSSRGSPRSRAGPAAHPNVTVIFASALGRGEIPPKSSTCSGSRRTTTTCTIRSWARSTWRRSTRRSTTPSSLAGSTSCLITSRPGGLASQRHRHPPPHRAGDGAPRGRGGGLPVRRGESHPGQSRRPPHRHGVRQVDPRPHRPVYLQVPQARLRLGRLGRRHRLSERTTAASPPWSSSGSRCWPCSRSRRRAYDR